MQQNNNKELTRAILQVLAFLACIVFSGCAKKTFTKNSELHSTDSVSIVEKVRIDTITTKADSVYFSIPVFIDTCKSLFKTPIRIKSGKSDLKIELSGNNIKASCLCSAEQLTILAKEREIERLKTQLTKTTEAKQVQKLPNWFTWGAFSILGITIFGVYRTIKKK
ncbi:MAG: hypothetical protein F9K23_15785 [Bacteroidetes bacterium]|nr:MAG: hypothetical protein F9K23_15785 [Bacteroidota bacterium]